MRRGDATNIRSGASSSTPITARSRMPRARPAPMSRTCARTASPMMPWMAAIHRRAACARSPTWSSRRWRGRARYPPRSSTPRGPSGRAIADIARDARWMNRRMGVGRFLAAVPSRRRSSSNTGEFEPSRCVDWDGSLFLRPRVPGACTIDETFKRGTRYPQGEHSPYSRVLVGCSRRV